MDVEMTSNRPYLIRAIYQWIIDNDMTPHLIVDATDKDVQVPHQHIEDGRIVLNINPSATSDMDLGNDWISFSTRFSGVSQQIFVPPHAVLGIYSRENGQGMLFAEDEMVESDDYEQPDPNQEPDPDNKPPSGGRPSLKVVK